MNKNFIFVMFLMLIVINVLTLNSFYKYKKQCITRIETCEGVKFTWANELRTYKHNFTAGILNSGISLNKKIEIRDCDNNNIALKDIFLKCGQKYLIVCRFSETNCESCINFSTKILHQWIDTTSISNVSFWGTYKNNRIYNQLKPMYGIEKFNSFNVSEFNIPAEENGYPYYFVLDSALNISNLFFPDKTAPEITKRYLEAIQKRYFENQTILSVER